VYWAKDPLLHISHGKFEHAITEHSYDPEVNLGLFYSLNSTARFYARIYNWMLTHPDFPNQVGAADQKIFDFALRGTSTLIPEGMAYEPQQWERLPHALFWHNMQDDWKSEGDHHRVTYHLSFGLGLSTNRIAAAKEIGLLYEKQTLKTPTPHDIVIVGAGLSGAVLAREHASAGHPVLVLEKRNHIGGNCYDYIDPDTGIRVSKYGAHLFHTNNEEVWKYINHYSNWTRWDHKVLAWVEDDRGRFVHVPVPVNINTVNTLVQDANIRYESEMGAWLETHQVKYEHKPQNSEEMARSRVGNVMYEKIFGPYTQKQWNMSASSLGPEVTARIPVRGSFDDRYFDDKYQVLPTNGYTAFFESLLDHPNITVRLDTDYFQWKSDQPAGNEPIHTYYTGPIDRFFESHERLEYRSLRFESEVVLNHVGHVLPASVVNYPSMEFPFTRIIEYKQMLAQRSPHSVIVKEFPSSDGEPYYPIPNKRNKDLYDSLVAQTARFSDITFVGRLANYKYFNMDEAIWNALVVFRDNVGRLPM
jgi:UDP-galactopyranose mutase